MRFDNQSMELWLSLKTGLAGCLDENEVKAWIEPLSLRQEAPGQLVLACPNAFHRQWVNEHYLAHLRKVLEQTLPGASLRLAVSERKPAAAPALITEPRPTQPRQLALPNIQAGQSPLNRRFVFERFIKGRSNELAYAAARAMAEGQRYLTDTLFLVSDTGLGKSHLTQAVGNHVFSQGGQKRVTYLTAEDFASQLYSALRGKRMEQFKDLFRRHCDLLLLEGVQFLVGKEKTQDELIYTLDALLNAGKRAVFTGDTPPNRIKGLKKDLASRLGSGLTAPIEPPDHATRVAILQAMAAEDGHHFNREILEYLADQLVGDVRRLGSALVGLIVKSSLTGRAADLSLAAEVVGQYQLAANQITAAQIRDLAARVYGLTREDLTGKSRRKAITRPRNLAMFLARKHTNASYASIGKLFNRDHTTVMYGVGQVDSGMNTDAKLKQELSYLEQQLGVRES